MIPNYDPETGIHYGVIGANSIDPEAVENIYIEGEDLDAKYVVKQIRERAEAFVDSLRDWIPEREMARLTEHVYNMAAGVFLDNYEPCEPLIRYESGGYIILYSTSSNTLIVEKSPYCTKCKMCSPCYPNAGDLDSPDMSTDFWTYCLGADFFENEANTYAIVEVSQL